MSVIDFRVRLPNELRPALAVPEALSTQYDEILSITRTMAKTIDDLKAEMKSAGVGHAVLHAEYEYADPADELNEAVAQLVRSEGDRFSGMGTVSLPPHDVMRAVRQVEYCGDQGLIGISLQPSFFHLPIDDRRLYPIYAKAAERGLMVALHTGINYGVTHPIRNDHPLMLDDVACAFPELMLVACHAGWPWIPEMVAVARKHPTVYLEFGGLAPKYIGAAGSGWEVMYRFMNSVLAEQILFGTDWPVMTHERTLSEWRNLGLKDHVLEGALGGNAARLLQRTS